MHEELNSMISAKQTNRLAPRKKKDDEFWRSSRFVEDKNSK
jgi:hypothetical protein